MNKKLKILISIILGILISVFFLVTKENKKEITNRQDLLHKQVLPVENTEYENKNSEQTTVYYFMEQLKNEGKIDFKEKTYTGMGKFIEEINGIKNNGNKNWIYYVNGKKANIGISNYKINNGDIVSWKYESSY